MELENLQEMEISSQDISKNGWKLIKRYKDEKNHYYALIECINCGNQKLVNYYNFINTKIKPLKCIKCKYIQLAKEEEGLTFGTIKVIGLDHINIIERSNSNKTDTLVYYNTICTKCGKTSIRLRNLTQWKNSNGCKHCNSAFLEPSYNNLLMVYKQGATNRGIQWDLSNEEFLSLITKDCYYCGESPSIREHDNSVNKLAVMGIDRVDNSKSYVYSNCVPCCTKCNFMKQGHTLTEFLNQVKKIYKHLY